MKLHFSPVSTYSQKALIAFYEKDIAFTPVIENLMDPAGRASYMQTYPVCKVPLLVDEGRSIPESSTIIEYLDLKYPNKGPRLLPQDPMAALEARRWDRFCDSYLNDTMQKIFFDGFRPADKKDPFGVAQAKDLCGRAAGLLDAHLAGKTWLSGADFGIADCAAAPALFYLQRVAPFSEKKNLVSYAGRLFERPSFARCVEEAKPILAAMGM